MKTTLMVALAALVFAACDDGGAAGCPDPTPFGDPDQCDAPVVDSTATATTEIWFPAVCPVAQTMDGPIFESGDHIVLGTATFEPSARPASQPPSAPRSLLVKAGVMTDFVSEPVEWTPDFQGHECAGSTFFFNNGVGGTVDSGRVIVLKGM